MIRAMYAPARRRAAALVLDLVVVLVLLFALAVVAALALGASLGAWTWAIVAAYFVLLPLTSWRGTAGKRASGIAIVDVAGRPIGPLRSALRFGASLLSLASAGAGYAVCFWNERRRALHDYVAGTVVIDAKAQGPAPSAPAMAWPARAVKSALVVGLVVFPVWLEEDFLHGREARAVNADNAAQAATVIAAIDAYRRDHDAYPPDLPALVPRYLAAPPRLRERSSLYYRADPSGQDCRLAIVFWLRPGLMPSDDAREYDCASRQWEVLDYSELSARAEGGFTPARNTTP
jgi:uncharacterized RDD family membrane protein YckC